MAFMTDTTSSSAPLFAQGRGPGLSPRDIFRGSTTDRLGDGSFADPRETRLIDAFNKLRKLNQIVGDPLGIDQPRKPPARIQEQPEPPVVDNIMSGERDP